MEIIEELKVFDDNLLSQLNKLSTNKIDYWDIRAGLTLGNNIDFTNQKSKEVSSYEIMNCGIRTFLNGGWGFYILNNLDKNSIIKGFSKAIQLAIESEKLSKTKFQIQDRKPFMKNYSIIGRTSLKDTEIEKKIAFVKEHEKISSNFSEQIKNTRTVYLDNHSDSIFVDSFGSFLYQEIEILRLFSSVYANENGITQNALNSIGGIGGIEILENQDAQNVSIKSAKQAIELLNAKSPIGGKFTVIMDPKLTGTFIHEAFGHACEADHVLNKESILEDKIGQQVAIDEITIIDDPTLGQGKKFNLNYELYGSYPFDDEGVVSQKTKLVENGILKNFLHNLETSSRMDQDPNGHGRANSNVTKPQVRMGFTYLEPRDWALEEMIQDTKIGILCEDFQYGYTDPTTGNFQFKCRFSHKIENGKLKEILRDVSLSGMTLEVLNRISAIGNFNTFNYSDGVCGKGGQGIRVCNGGPYIRIENLTLGGLN
jgi:TldD protein